MHVAFPFLLPVATGIRIMYCMNDCLRDYQQEMKLRLFEEWEFHRDRKSTRLNSSHSRKSRMPSSA